MALVHPGKVSPIRVEREIHPAVCLAAGFGIITLMATGVHLLFGLF